MTAANIPAATPPEHSYGDQTDCACGRNFSTVRGLREHLTKARQALMPPPDEREE